MNEHIRKKVILVFVNLLVLITFMALFSLIISPDLVSKHKKSNTVIFTALELDPFLLITHNNDKFSNKDLIGKWHIISYGYTQCPDICPMTLLTLTRLSYLIKKNNEIKNVSFLFYTVDPERDTINRLAQYVSYFDNDFIGIRKNKDTSYLNFEKNLGMQVKIKNKHNQYYVSHGLAIYLIDPDAKLHAIFKPTTNSLGHLSFTPKDIYQDLLKLHRNYLVK